MIREHPDLFGAVPEDLVLNTVGSGPVLDYYYVVSFCKFSQRNGISSSLMYSL